MVLSLAPLCPNEVAARLKLLAGGHELLLIE